MKLKFANALSLALIVAMLFTSVALADNVENDIVADPATITLQAGVVSSYVDVQFYVQPTGGDSDPQCNFDSTSEQVTFTINTPSGVTANPSALTFNKCHVGSNFNYQSVRFSANGSAVSGSISFTQTFNNSGGTFDYSNAVFYINVTPPPNTPPTVSVTGVANGANYNKGFVPVPMCDVTDAEDNPADFVATLSAITGPYATDGIGSQTASCSYTDAGGLTATASATYSIVDPSAPSISYTLNPAAPDGSNGWYKSNVSLTWNVSEPESPNSLSKTDCGDQNITADQGETTYSCSASSAGGSTGPVEVKTKRDATAPTISGSASPAPNGAGWNKTDVAVSFTCNDNLSGIASCGPDATLSTEGAGQSVSGTAIDNAGNSASTAVGPINIDKTVPTISASINPAAAGTGWYNSTTGAPTVSFSCNDTGGSGLAGACPIAVTLGEGADQSVSAGPVSDVAGNSSSTATISNIDVDLTAPTVALVGGAANGDSYYFGSVPAAPTCSASDVTSGLAGACSVSGYGTTVGIHTVTASATDNAGNSATASATYTVLAWTLNGFYQPVDIGILNNVKGGSTVPLKFEVFAGPTELTNTSIVSAFTQRISCASGTGDDIEQYATGGTSLRYDTTGGQFIFNWQTLRQPGACYRVTLTTSDGSSIFADFRLK